ncbi:hypothetical protein D3C87_1242890 [compost metagenome]
MVNGENSEMPTAKVDALAAWHVLLRDETSLIAAPGRFHKMLIKQARALHEAQVIDADELSDLLEHADGALAYAVEAMLDGPDDE